MLCLIRILGRLRIFLRWFRLRYSQAVYDVTGLTTLIHKNSDDRGQMLAQTGLKKEHAKVFFDAPFNLSPSAARAYGPTVIAFKENKTSYLKNWHEIEDKLRKLKVRFLRRK